jgi:hypothetical protein
MARMSRLLCDDGVVGDDDRQTGADNAAPAVALCPLTVSINKKAAHWGGLFADALPARDAMSNALFLRRLDRFLLCRLSCTQLCWQRVGVVPLGITADTVAGPEWVVGCGP